MNLRIEKLISSFESNFGFIPPNSVKEIKLKNWGLYLIYNAQLTRNLKEGPYSLLNKPILSNIYKGCKILCRFFRSRE